MHTTYNKSKNMDVDLKFSCRNPDSFQDIKVLTKGEEVKYKHDNSNRMLIKHN
jgi:hypothetical protein